MCVMCYVMCVYLSSLMSGMQSTILNLSCLFSCSLVHATLCVFMCLNRLYESANDFSQNVHLQSICVCVVCIYTGIMYGNA